MEHAAPEAAVGESGKEPLDRVEPRGRGNGFQPLPGKLIHAILDNYATHKHPQVTDWLARHPRWVFHFSASWLNAVEGFFSILTRRRLERGVFKSVTDLKAAIARYVREHNKTPKPFVCTTTASAMLTKLDRLPVPSE
jgi:hypothetical protein